MQGHLTTLDGCRVAIGASPKLTRGLAPARHTARLGKELHNARLLRLPRSVSLETAPDTKGVNTAPQRLRPTDPSGQPASSDYKEPTRGKPDPLGSTIDPETGAVNFAIFSSSAWQVMLCLFTEKDLLAGKVTHEIKLSPQINKTGDVWHIALPDVDSTLLYGYRIFGPNETEHTMSAGHRYNINNVVLDPYAQAIFNGRRKFGDMGADLDYANDNVLGIAPTWPQAACALPSPPSFDWEGDRPLNRPAEDLIVYEMHVRGFTQHASSKVSTPGTYQGMVERLDYLQWLGVTAVELMPIFEFNELEYYRVDPSSQFPDRYNFWGYSTVGFFAPMSRFSSAAANGPDGEAVKNEFKQFVKECHKRGIEVILDVVFNHTAEGNENGPSISFRGLDNRVYYMLAPGGEYYNYSGCGNTFNCNHPVGRKFILDCLKYWVEEFHVDGFRFDLASIMTRAHSMWHKQEPASLQSLDSFDGSIDSGFSEDDYAPSAPFSSQAIVDENGNMTDGAGLPTGTPLSDPPLIAAISADPILASTKLIAEAWDCDGLNQVGAFPHYGGRWSEWNGHFRDTVRQFLKGTDGSWAGSFASAICGSPNIYVNEPGEHDWWGNNGGRRWKGGRGPTASVNFVTAHDGFTLYDLVAYNEKHNEANGEDNRDGESHNLSWNCGEEGPTDDNKVVALRRRQMKNMMLALLVSHGIPMVLMGDEYGHTKGGNNNTYCHDSALNYFDWDAATRDDHGLLRFTRHVINFRKTHKELRRSWYVSDGEIEWHGIEPNTPDWSEESRFLAFSMRNEEGGGLYVAFNSSHLATTVALPELEGRVWQQVVDTSKSAPYDVLVADERLPEEEVAAARAGSEMWTLANAYPMLPWSAVVLESVPITDLPSMPDSRRVATAVPSLSAPGGQKTASKRRSGSTTRRSSGGRSSTKKENVSATEE